MSLKEEKNAFKTDGNGTDDGDLGIRKTIINTYHVFQVAEEQDRNHGNRVQRPKYNFRRWTLSCSSPNLQFSCQYGPSFLLYLMGYNLLLTLFILILKLYLIWPVGAPSNCYLCPFDMAQSFFEYFTF